MRRAFAHCMPSFFRTARSICQAEVPTWSVENISFQAFQKTTTSKKLAAHNLPIPMRSFSLFLSCFFLLSASAQDGNLGLNQGNADVKNHLLQVDLLSLAGEVTDLRFEAGLNARSSMSIRGVVLEQDSLAASFFALSYRMYPIQALGNAPKGFYIGPRMYRGSIAEMVPDGNEPVGEEEEVDYEWNEVVSGLGFGFETGYQFNTGFGLTVDLGIALNVSQQVIQFSGEGVDDAFTRWPQPSFGLGWRF